MTIHPGGVKTKRRHLSPSDIRRKNDRRQARNAAPLHSVVLEGLTIPALRELAEAREIKLPSKIKKAQIIEMMVGR